MKHYLKEGPGMNLQTRVIIIFICVGVMVIALVGVLLPITLNQDSLETVTESSNVQLQLVDYSLSSFVESTKNHVMELSLNPVVRNPDDKDFTNYLDADEETFEFHITGEEQAIIDILNNYRTTNPYVNSVYMGRENGAFVRSHPRARNTAYDPRDRPWYILAKENPESVMFTEPYPSVTTNDVNIGVVKALLDENSSVYGVVGADITLTNMTSYMSGFVPGRRGEIIIVDINGVILSGKELSYQYSDVSKILDEKKDEFISTDNGTIFLDGNYLIYRTSPDLGWKIGVFIPMLEIEKETNEAILDVLTYLISGLVLLSVFSLVILNRNFIKPLSDLTAVSRRIAETGELDQEIPTGGAGEIEVLAGTFRDMIERIKQEEKLLNLSIRREQEAQAELQKAHDVLEEKVEQRTSELAEANERLKDLDRLKSMFIASMSHELRTPLNSIIGFTVILLKGWTGELNEEQIKQLKIIENSSRHLLTLINDVIDISKIEAGTIELSLSSFDLVTVIKEVVLSFGEKAKEQKISLLTEIPESIDIFGDERRTRQILINLMGNAIKFTDEGSVTLRAVVEGENAVVSVKDTGIGIPEEKFDSIFKPFFRVHTEGRLTEGTGLGLYLSQKIAHALGGGISFGSIQGEGSEFTLIIPLRSEEN